MNDEQWQALVGKNKKASCQHSTRDMIHAIFHVQATAASGVLTQDCRKEIRSATPSATDVTPTRHVGALLALLHRQVRTELSVVIIDSQSVKTVSK